jgi:hypothetical protein
LEDALANNKNSFWYTFLLAVFYAATGYIYVAQMALKKINIYLC